MSVSFARGQERAHIDAFELAHNGREADGLLAIDRDLVHFQTLNGTGAFLRFQEVGGARVSGHDEEGCEADGRRQDAWSALGQR